MALRGDFNKLANLARGFEKLASAGWRRRYNQLMGETGLALVHGGFDRGMDPYGRAWAPLKSRPGGRPLMNTNYLRSTFRLAITATGFRLSSRHPGANLHNRGGVIVPVRAKMLVFAIGGSRGGARGRGAQLVFAKRVVIPKRQIFPDRQRLGGMWTSALRATAVRALRGEFDGARR